MKKYYQGKPLTQNKADMKKEKFKKWIDFESAKAFFGAKTYEMSHNVPQCPQMSHQRWSHFSKKYDIVLI